MAECPSGSEPRPGVVGTLIVAGALLEAIVTKRAPWLAPFIGALAPLVLETGSLCGSDPPPFPTFTPDDLGDLVTGKLVPKISDAIENLAWYELCQCSGGAAPATPAPAPPAGTPTRPGGPLLPCEELTRRLEVGVEGVDGGLTPVVGTQFSPRPLPAGTTSVTQKGRIVVRGAPPFDTNRTQFELYFYDSAGLLIPPARVIDLDPAVDADRFETATYATPSNATAVFVQRGCQPGGGPCPPGRVEEYWLGFNCGSPTAFQPDCCPPDPTLIAKLTDMQLLLNLIVARLGPASELEPIVSRSVTGEGQIGLELGARLIRLSLDVLGAGVETVPYANPDRVMRAGTVRFGNAFGWQRRVHVDARELLVAVPLDMDVVSWSLSPGTSGTLTQLGQPL